MVKKQFKPKIGQEYWFTGRNVMAGLIFISKEIWKNSIIDRKRLSVDAVFSTEKDAVEDAKLSIENRRKNDTKTG